MIEKDAMVYFGSPDNPNTVEAAASAAPVRTPWTSMVWLRKGHRQRAGIWNRGRMGRRRQIIISGLIFACALSLATTVHAQSASSWSKRGEAAEAREDYDAAFEAYRQARLLKPNDLGYKTHFERIRFLASNAHIDRGRVMRQSGDINGALLEFQRALAIDGGNQAAQQEILITHTEMSSAADSLDRQAVLPVPLSITAAGPVVLQPVSNDPITMNLVEDTKVIYQTIGKLAGLNVIFDPDYTSKRIQVNLNAVSLPDAFRILGTISGTFWKPVTSNTIFVAQNTKNKRTDMDQLAVQTFYLSNVAAQNDANEVLTALRNILDATVKVFLVPSQNAIVMRATPDQLQLAQMLINNLDRAKAEVVVDVAILEVNRDKARNLGITLPQSFTVTPQATSASTSGTGTGSTTTNPTLTDLAHATGANFAVTVGSAAVNALLTDSDTRILQNPKIRATDGQRAQLKIGQKIPVATGSYNSGVSTGLSSIGVQTQFTYMDIGVNIDMTPTVHQDREVTLKMKIEVTTHANDVTISGVTEPIIGQRSADQVIQLKEGEPSILAGILTRSESNILSGTPGLSDIPFLKRLFSSTNTDHSQDEIVFLLIPHIVRAPMLTKMNTRAIDTGTGQAIELRQMEAPAESAPVMAPKSAPTTAAAAAASMIGSQNGGAAEAARAAQMASADGPVGQAIAAKAAVAPAAGVAPVNFTIVPPNGNQNVGSTFQMAILASNAVDLFSAPMQVQFNSSVLQLVNVDTGEFLGRDGQAVALAHRDEGNGTVAVSISRPPAVAGMTGQGSVAVLTFKAIAPGDSNVSLTKVAAKNSTQTSLPAAGSQAVVHVK